MVDNREIFDSLRYKAVNYWCGGSRWYTVNQEVIGADACRFNIVVRHPSGEKGTPEAKISFKFSHIEDDTREDDDLYGNEIWVSAILSDLSCQTDSLNSDHRPNWEIASKVCGYVADFLGKIQTSIDEDSYGRKYVYTPLE